MNELSLSVAMILLLTWTDIATAQETSLATDLQRDLQAAKAAVTTSAEELTTGLIALVPSVPGWSCNEEEERENTAWMNPIPSAHFNCTHIEQSLKLSLLLDPSSASVVCTSIANNQQGITEGRIVPDLFRFFEGDQWQLLRSSVDLKGCALNTVVLFANGNRSEAAIAQGPASIDAFAEAFLGTDPSDLVAESSDHAEKLSSLLNLLDAQSRLLADHIPSPQGAIREVGLPSQAAVLGLPLPMILGFSPAATADLDIGGCLIHVEVSASPITIREAQTTGGRWASSRGEDGEVRGAFINRNTDRLIGRERVDGTGIEALVDQAIIVRVVIPGNHVCDGDPEIVQRIFEDILASDPASVVVP